MKQTAILLAGAFALATINLLAQPAAPGVPQGSGAPPVPPRPVGLFGPERNSSLVISTQKAEGQDLSQAEEDLNVMARILEKAANSGSDSGRRAMGISIENSIFGRDNPRNFYLEGYGAVFIVNVPFPLVPPESGSQAAQETTEAGSEWDEARQELYSGGSGGFALDIPKMIMPHLGPSQPYEKERVEELKNDVLSALKNAVHIRMLKPEDKVTVVITARGNAGESRVVTRASGGHSTVAVARAGGSTAAAPQSRMVIQAKRADIEAFQKGTLDQDQFKKKVLITLS